MSTHSDFKVPPSAIEDSGKRVDVFVKGDDPAVDTPLAADMRVSSSVNSKGQRLYNPIPGLSSGELSRRDEEVDVYLKFDH